MEKKRNNMKRTQCRFKRNGKETVAWIDSSAAKVGNHVELLSLDGEFWEVIGIGKPSTKDRSNQHRTFKNNI